MFTGIVKELSAVRKFAKAGGVYRLEVSSGAVYKEAAIGDSVSINGVCLTLVDKVSGVMGFDVMDETVRKTGLVALKIGETVNLEGALKAGNPMGGHFVLGHVDCVGDIKKIENKAPEYRILIDFPQEYNELIVYKGSITLDGISLTVGEAMNGSFSVYVIPHTLKVTNLGAKRDGDKVNIEFDIIGKYLARFRELDKRGGVTEKFLKEMGF